MPPTVAFTVDGTALSCKGAIAKLETEFVAYPPGSVARVLLVDVPTRIDVHAWAHRKGHRVVEDHRRDEVFELLIEKGSCGTATDVPGAKINAS